MQNIIHHVSNFFLLPCWNECKMPKWISFNYASNSTPNLIQFSNRVLRRKEIWNWVKKSCSPNFSSRSYEYGAVEWLFVLFTNVLGVWNVDFIYEWCVVGLFSSSFFVARSGWSLKEASSDAVKVFPPFFFFLVTAICAQRVVVSCDFYLCS